MKRGSAEWWAAGEGEDPPREGSWAFGRIQSELAAVPGDEQGLQSWRHIPRRCQGDLKEYLKRPDRIFEAMKDKSDTSKQYHHLSIQFGYVGSNEWEQRPLSISVRRHLENPDLIPNISWDSESNRYRTALRYTKGSQIHQYGPLIDIWSFRKEEFGSTSLPNEQKHCSACADLTNPGQCPYCGRSQNDSVMSRRQSRRKDRLCCYYTAAGIRCPSCNKYKNKSRARVVPLQRAPLQRATFLQSVPRNVCCKTCAFGSIIRGCPCCGTTD